MRIIESHVTAEHNSIVTTVCHRDRARAQAQAQAKSVACPWREPKYPAGYLSVKGTIKKLHIKVNGWYTQHTESLKVIDPFIL